MKYTISIICLNIHGWEMLPIVCPYINCAYAGFNKYNIKFLIAHVPTFTLYTSSTIKQLFPLISMNT